MPKGPKGEKRPADVVSNAVHVMRIATGQIEEESSKAAVRQTKGGMVRAKKLSRDRRQAIAKKAARARWEKEKA